MRLADASQPHRPQPFSVSINSIEHLGNSTHSHTPAQHPADQLEAIAQSILASHDVEHIHTLLNAETSDGQNAWFILCHHYRKFQLFSAVLQRAWQVAEQQYLQDPRRSILLQCRYALMTSVVQTIYAQLPIPLIIQLYNYEYWSYQHCLDYCRTLQDPEQRTQIVEHLIPLLPEAQIRDIITIFFQQLSCPLQARVIRVACETATRGIDRFLLKTSLRIESEYYRCLAIANVIKILEPQYFSQICQSIHSIQDKTNLCLILCQCTQRNHRYFDDLYTLLKDVTDEHLKTELIQTIIPSLSSTQLLQLNPLIQAISTPSLRLRLQQQIAQHSSTQAPNLQFELAQVEDDHAYVEILENLPYNVSSAVLNCILKQIPSFTDSYLQYQAYQCLIPSLTSSTITRFLRDAATLDNNDYTQLLIKVVRHCSDLDLTLIQAAIQRISSPTDRLTALCELSEHVPGLGTDILNLCQTELKPQLKAQALGVLSVHNPHYWPSYLEALFSVPVEQGLFTVMDHFLPQLPHCYRPQILDLMQTLEERQTYLQGIELLAPYLDESEVLEIYFEVIHLHHPGPFIEASDYFYSLEENLEQQIDISAQQGRIQALSALSAYLPDAMYKATLASSFTIPDLGVRAAAIRGLLSQMNGSDMQHNVWCQLIHTLSQDGYHAFLTDLVTLRPAILHLGQASSLIPWRDMIVQVSQQYAMGGINSVASVAPASSTP